MTLSKNFNLWIIEDDEAQRELSHLLLKETAPDLTVESFESGKTVLDAISKLNPEMCEKILFLCDLNLADMTALELLGKLRKAGFNGGKFIILSGTENQEVKIQAFNLGACAYVVKPFDLEKHKAFLQSLIHFWSWT